MQSFQITTTKYDFHFGVFCILLAIFSAFTPSNPFCRTNVSKTRKNEHFHKLKSKNWSDCQKLKKTMEASFTSNTSKLSIKQKMAIIAKENQMLRARSMISPTLHPPNCSNNQRPPPPPPPSWSTRGRGRGRGGLSRTSFSRCVDFLILREINFGESILKVLFFLFLGQWILSIWWKSAFEKCKKSSHFKVQSF